MIPRRLGFALVGILAGCTLERAGNGNGAAAGTPGTHAAAPATGAARDSLPRDSTSALLDTAGFAEAGGGRAIPVPMDTAGPPALAGSAEVARNITLYGSVGPYAFVATRLYQYACSAHGNTFEAFSVMNLATGTMDTLLDSAAAAQTAASRRDAIVEAFKVDTGISASGIEHPDSARLTMFVPRWTGDHLGLDLQFTTDACYACGDGNWSDYTRSVHLPAAALPRALQPYAVTPPEVAAAFRVLNPDSGAGWSLVALPPARRDALARLFGVTAPAGGQEYIVWHRAANGRFESAWLRGRGAEATIVGRQPDVWIVAGGHAWTWRTGAVRITVTPCSMQKGT